MWEVINLDGEKHVRPLEDLRPHGARACWCNPFEDEDVVVHNSMDRREYIERGEVKRT